MSGEKDSSGKSGEPSGVDLARVALRAAKEQARARAGQTRRTEGGDERT